MTLNDIKGRNFPKHKRNGNDILNLNILIQQLDNRLAKLDSLLNLSQSRLIQSPIKYSDTDNHLKNVLHECIPKTMRIVTHYNNLESTKQFRFTRDECLSPIMEESSDNETGFFGSNDESSDEYF
ncbi:hypothetical protein GJ496_009400 [Pomphorhynchus laevis]|nr:hypothetical protein GJ496_009400 [Pomphorhynchus laevis]